MSVGGVGPGGGPGDILAALRDGRIEGREQRLEAASRLLEGSFYEQLFKAMRDSVPEGGALSGGQGQDVFEGLFDQHVAETAAMRAERGLGDALFHYLAGPAGITPGDGPSSDGS